MTTETKRYVVTMSAYPVRHQARIFLYAPSAEIAAKEAFNADLPWDRFEACEFDAAAIPIVSYVDEITIPDDEFDELLTESGNDEGSAEFANMIYQFSEDDSNDPWDDYKWGEGALFCGSDFAMFRGALERIRDQINAALTYDAMLDDAAKGPRPPDGDDYNVLWERVVEIDLILAEVAGRLPPRTQTTP